MFRDFEAPIKMKGWRFSKLNFNNKGAGDNFSCYKTLGKVLL